MKTPFANCRVIDANVGYETYAKQDHEPGNLRFVMSRGELMRFADCPAKWLKGIPDDSTKGTDWGDFLDTLLLQPARANAKFAITPETYKGPKGEKPWTYKVKDCRIWRNERIAQGQKVVTSEVAKRVQAAIQAMQNDRGIIELLNCSKKQVMVTGEYQDRETGICVPLKALLDIVPPADHPRFGKDLADLKSAGCAGSFDLGRAIDRYHYDAQAYLYRTLYCTATGEDRPSWRLVVQENEEPYQPEMYLLSEYFMENGSLKILNALRLYCWCLENNTWPGYRHFAQRRFAGESFIDPEEWMITRLARFCAIPEIGGASA